MNSGTFNILLLRMCANRGGKVWGVYGAFHGTVVLWLLPHSPLSAVSGTSHLSCLVVFTNRCKIHSPQLWKANKQSHVIYWTVQTDTFTARHYAIARYMLWLSVSVCPFVCHLANCAKHMRRIWFWPIRSIMWKHDVIHKIGVRTFLHCRQRRTKPRPQVTRTENLWNWDVWLWDMRADRQRGRQTDTQPCRHADDNISHPHEPGDVRNCLQKIGTQNHGINPFAARQKKT